MYDSLDDFECSSFDVFRTFLYFELKNAATVHTTYNIALIRLEMVIVPTINLIVNYAK